MDIGSLTGSVSIEDQFSSTLTIAADAVKSFAAEFDGMVGGIVTGAGIAAAAVVGLTAAVVTLGVEGSNVNDVSSGFDRLAGSTENATNILAAMRKGTSDTVTDMNLMVDANKLLATGAVGNADDFGTLTAASQVLAREGFGSVDSVLNTLSRSMETGMTRRLALMGVTVDTLTAEKNYAASLDETTAGLTKAQKLIIDRQTIMASLATTVSSAGAQELSFAQKIDQVKVSIQDWIEELESAVASSSTLSTVFDGLKSIFQDLFGGTQEESIKTVVGLINSLVVGFVDLGIGGTQVATIIITAWNAIKLPILAVEQVIVGLAADFLRLVDIAVTVATKVPVIGSQFVGLKGSLDGMTEATTAAAAGLDVEFKEALSGVAGHSAAQQAVDKLGGSLFVLRDAAESAASATTQHTAANTAFVGPTEEMLVVVTETAAQIEATEKLWDAYFKAVNAGSHDTVTAQIDDVWLAADAQIAAMEKAKTIVVADYAIIWATAEQTVNNIIQKTLESDQYTVEHYQLIADKAQQAYDFALDHVTSYSNAEIRLLHDADVSAEYDVNHWSSVAGDAIDKTAQKTAAMGATAVQAGTTAATAFNTMGDALNALDNGALSAAQIQVRGLNGEVTSLADAIKNLDAGNSITYDFTTAAGQASFMKLNPGATFSPGAMAALAAGQLTLQQAVDSGLVNLYGGYGGQTGTTGQSFDEGGPVKQTGTALVHAGEFVVPASGALVANGSSNGGDVYISVDADLPLLIRQVSAGQLKASNRRFSRAS